MLAVLHSGNTAEIPKLRSVILTSQEKLEDGPSEPGDSELVGALFRARSLKHWIKPYVTRLP